MTAHRFAAALAAIALVGCAGSDDEPDLVPDTTPITIVSDEELLDGAFEENDGESVPGDTSDSTTDEPSSTEPATEPTSTSVSTDGGSETTGGSDAGAGDTTTTTPSSGSSTTGGGSSTGGTSDSTGGSSATTGGTATTGDTTTGGSDTGGVTTGSATDGSTGGTDGSSSSVGSTGEIDALTGVITIGDDAYAFPIDGCTVLNEETSATGEATRDGIPFIARITSSLIDLDDDGSDDRTIEINLETNPDADGDHPDFYVVGIQAVTVSTKYDIEFSVTPERITASGPIEDNNRVAIAEGETLPMTTDVRCA